MAKTYLGVWSTYWYITNTANPNSDEDFRGRWKFYYEQNQSTLTSTITVEHYIQIYSSEYIQNGYIPPSTSKATVNNSSSTKSNSALNVSIAKGYSERLIGTSTFTIQHNSEGKANLAFSGQWTMSGTTRKASHTWALPDIPVASSISANVSEQILGNDIIFTITPRENTYVHLLKFKYGTSSETQFDTNVTTTSTWQPPISLAQYVTNNTYGTATIYCYSYDGTISDANYKGVSTTTVKLNIPSSVVPTGTLTVSDDNTTSTSEAGKVPSSWGIYVKGYSKLKFVAATTMAQGATLTSIKITSCDGQIGTSTPFTSPNNVGVSGNNLTNTLEITDSRGRIGTATATINVYDYEAPNATLNVSRCDSQGVYDANGEKAKLTITYGISSLNNNNAKTYTIKYRVKGASSYTTYSTGTLSNYSGTLEVTITSVTFDTSKTYEFLVVITDQFNSTEAPATMAYSRKPISVKKTAGVTFGRHAVDDGFNVYYDADFKMALTKLGKAIPCYQSIFHSDNGETGDIVTSVDPTTFSSIEIFGMDNNDKKGAYVKIINPTANDSVCISVVEAGTGTYIRRTRYTITSSGLTYQAGGYSNIAANGSTSTNTSQNYIKITDVIGWL